MDCSACKQEIKKASEILRCTGCSDNFHYACMNITSIQYQQHKTELKLSWLCPNCHNITRRPRNDDTPVRKQLTSILDETTMSVDGLDEQNNKTHDHCEMYQTQTLTNMRQNTSNITLEQISSLLDRKLEENKQATLQAIKNTIITEINNTIHEFKDSFKKTTNALTLEQTDIKTNIKLLEDKINNLEIEITQNRHQISTLQNKQIGFQQQNTDYTKKLVLHGLLEHGQETEQILHQRLINLFQEILNLDLTGYIEDQQRIGRRNGRRPVVIELISKKMTKYILHNSQYFRNTGLNISEYLNDELLQQRKRLLDQLRCARQNGHHAVIRNNKLFVDGKLTLDYHSDLQAKSTSASQSSNSTSTLNNTTLELTQRSLNSSQHSNTAGPHHKDENFRTFRHTRY